MRKLSGQPWLIAFLFFVIGAVSTWGAEKLWVKAKDQQPTLHQVLAREHSNFDELFNRDFFSQSRDPFKEMQRLHNQILKDFGSVDAGPDHFDSWFQKNFGGGEPSDFNIREDDGFVYYEIGSQAGVPKKVDVKVERGQVTVSGEVESETKTGDSSSTFSSTFVRSFPAPANVDADKFQVDYQDKKIVIKFPKVKGGPAEAPSAESTI